MVLYKGIVLSRQACVDTLGQQDKPRLSAFFIIFVVFVVAPNHTIALQFERLETECAYDFIHVYDGPSFQDTLLASFSGDIGHKPAIRAHSGSV